PARRRQPPNDPTCGAASGRDARSGSGTDPAQGRRTNAEGLLTTRKASAESPLGRASPNSGSSRPAGKRDRPGAGAPDERGRAPDDAEGVCAVPSWECLPQLRVAPSGRRSRGGQAVPATIADEARPIVGSWSLDLASLGTGSLPAAERGSHSVPLATVTPRAARPPPPNHDGIYEGAGRVKGVNG